MAPVSYYKCSTSNPKKRLKITTDAEMTCI